MTTRKQHINLLMIDVTGSQVMVIIGKNAEALRGVEVFP